MSGKTFKNVSELMDDLNKDDPEKLKKTRRKNQRYYNRRWAGYKGYNSDLNPKGYYGCIQTFTYGDKALKINRKMRDKLGFDRTECYNLDWTLCHFLLPRLIHFKKEVKNWPGVPGMLLPRLKEGEWHHTDEQHDIAKEKWFKIIDEIIIGLRAKLRDCRYNKENEKKWRRAKVLLFRYLDTLWW